MTQSCKFCGRFAKQTVCPECAHSPVFIFVLFPPEEATFPTGPITVPSEFELTALLEEHMGNTDAP